MVTAETLIGSGGGERRCSLVGLSLTLCDLTLSLGEQCQN